jgi:hypothetical protein
VIIGNDNKDKEEYREYKLTVSHEEIEINESEKNHEGKKIKLF